MYNSLLDELLNLLKCGLLWYLVTVIFTTAELREEAFRHLNSGVVRISGVCYGYNLIQGYRAIGQLFPNRCWAIRLDYILGYVKMLLLCAIAIGFLLLMA